MVFPISVQAKTDTGIINQDVEETTVVISPRLTFRCQDTACEAILEFQYSLNPARCIACGSIVAAYRCPACSTWYAICPSGHYNPTYGR